MTPDTVEPVGATLKRMLDEISVIEAAFAIFWFVVLAADMAWFILVVANKGRFPQW